MDFIGGINLKQIGTSLVNEGVGTAGGFLTGAVIGRRSENYFVPVPVTPLSTTTEKVKAWAANNIPKIAGWYLLGKYDAGSEVMLDAKKALMGSVVYDSVLRLANSGVPQLFPTIFGLGGEPITNSADLNKLIQKNAYLEAELGKALKQLGVAPGQAGQIRVQEVPGAPLPPPWPLTERSRREQNYGFMPGTQSAQFPEAVRRRQYGFVGEHQSASEDIAKMFGML